MYNKRLDNVLIDMRHDNNNKNENRDDNRCVNSGVNRGVNRGVSRGMSFASDNRGIGVVEIVLILVVLVALVIIFKDKIIEIINKAFESITSGTDSL